MGIRKIQGASVRILVYLAGKKFMIVLLISSVMGSAGGYYLSKMLLDSIWDYFVDIKAVTLILSASIMIAATTLTIFFKIAGAAMKNPVISLRYE